MDGKGNYIYDCTDISNYDGDSFRLTINKKWDFGFGIHVTQENRISARIIGVDTPELRDSRPEFKAAGYLAKQKAELWVNGLESVKFISLDKPDKYGRALGDFQRADGARLSDYLIEKRYGVKYEGQNKQDVEEAHRENIKYLQSRKEI